MQIFITRGEDSSGPYTLEQVQDYLAQGVLLPGDLAYHEGLEGWIPLSQLMASIAAPVDPAPPQPVAITPELVQSGPTIESAPIKAGDKKKLLIGVGVAVLVIAAVTWLLMGPGKAPKTPKPDQQSKTGPIVEPKKPGSFLWKFVTGDQVNSSPAIGSDGTVYVGSRNSKVYAIDGKTGAKKWEFETGGSVWSSPAIGSGDTVYVGSGDKKVYALNGKSGVKLWEFETGDDVDSSPAIGPDGTVYVGSSDKKVYALNGKSGAKLWEFETGGNVDSNPAIGSDGTVYVGSSDNKVYAINGKSGAKLWEFETGAMVESSPAIGSDGTVYVGSHDKKVYALNGKSGVKLWEFETGLLVDSSPAIGSDDTVYIGSYDSKVYALDGKSGVKLWEFKTKLHVRSSPAIGSDGTVYVGSNDKKLYAINGKSGIKLWEFETGTGNIVSFVHSSPAIGSDGTVYAGSTDKKLYAIKTDSKGLAKSPWPMRGQNAQHTGRAIGVATTKPSEPTPPANSKLTDALINKWVGISIEGDELWVQLNPDGTTLDYKGLTGTFRIENLTLSVQDDDGITMVEFVAPNPKEGDAVTVTGTREPGSPPILGPIKAKLVTLTKINDSGPTGTIPAPPPIPNPSEPEPTKPGAGLWEFETGNYVYSSR